MKIIKLQAGRSNKFYSHAPQPSQSTVGCSIWIFNGFVGHVRRLICRQCARIPPYSHSCYAHWLNALAWMVGGKRDSHFATFSSEILMHHYHRRRRQGNHPGKRELHYNGNFGWMMMFAKGSTDWCLVLKVDRFTVSSETPSGGSSAGISAANRVKQRQD